jgi:hypothetical protein
MNKLKIFIGLVYLIISGQSQAQKYSIYSDDTLSIQSKYLQRSITLNLHLPETFHFSAISTKYPITIIFDSQHERTYPQIINSFDLLSSESQIPESIIIGIPFDIQNRYHLTSNQKNEGDSLSGMERMELFIFTELIPKLKNENKANEFLTIIGHSRTAFLVNYLSFKRIQDVNIAISLSGFFSEPPLTINTFSEFLFDPKHFSKQFSYYSSSGNTLEESTYLVQYQNVFKTPIDTSVSGHLKRQFKINPHTNHMTNYWMSIPEILITAFSDYNFILDNWLHKRLKDNALNKPVDIFKSDLKVASDKIGFELLPSLTHIFSMASHYGYQTNEYSKALNFLELGLQYYPDYLEFYVETIEFNKLLKDNNKVNYYKSMLREKAEKSVHISAKDRQEILEYLDEQ